MRHENSMHILAMIPYFWRHCMIKATMFWPLWLPTIGENPIGWSSSFQEHGDQGRHGCNVQSQPGRGQKTRKSMNQMLWKFGWVRSANRVSSEMTQQARWGNL